MTVGSAFEWAKMDEGSWIRGRLSFVTNVNVSVERREKDR